MKWCIPAKTFLVGEYVALAGGPAILLTTEPCFEARLQSRSFFGPAAFHPNSPAGRYWCDNNRNNLYLSWKDPYQECGGLGASSAQFLAAYQAHHYLDKHDFSDEQMLDDYYRVAWNGQGIRPSGYDILAQRQSLGCVYIHREKKILQVYDWPFKNLTYVLIKTPSKLATHNHLHKQGYLPDVTQLSRVVKLAKQACDRADEDCFIDAINQYHKLLLDHQWVSPESRAMIDQFKKDERILAAKGCGAMGADIILLIVHRAARALLKFDAYKVIAC
jgi:mevalonate kinase